MTTASACGTCGATMAPGAGACSRCGSPAWFRCPRCGGMVTAGARFCGTCGLAFAAPPPPEQVLGAIPEARIKTGMFGSDMYILVVTDRRLLGAKVTGDLMKRIIEEARATAKARGSGFFGQWKAQIGASISLARRYEAMPPEAILAETPGNWALTPDQVREIKVERHEKDVGEDITQHYLRIVIESATGRAKYDTDTEHPDRDTARAMLSVAFGPRVR